YLRKQFNIIDTSVIQEAKLHMDYDDGFVAYLNGVEIARYNMTGTPPPFDQVSDSEHEALLYQGIIPEEYIIDKATLSALLNQGNNVLAIQVHNWDISSSDMSAIPFLSLGISDTSYNYGPTPTWFLIVVSLDSSNLPIVVINTNGQEIADEPKVSATIGVIYNGVGVRNYFTDPHNNYSGFCGIELRGETSLGFAKKSYGFEFWDWLGNDVDVSFLNFPAEEDFILYGPYSDKSLLNNALAMKLARNMGHYSSRTRFVELVINNDYKGVYLVMEKIKRDNDRVDVATLNPIDTTGDQLTGGYIFRIDKGVYDGWTSQYPGYASSALVDFQFYYPDQVDIVPQQKVYIQAYVDSFENAVASPSFLDSAGNHYSEFIDLRSFVDNFILNELSKNVDAYRLSTYFYKDRDSLGGKITASPFWDFNLAFANADYCGGEDSTGWEYYQCAGPGPFPSPFWWDAMLGDTMFVNALRCRWDSLRQTIFHADTINAYIDSMETYLMESQTRNFLRWPVMGIYLWPNSWFYAAAISHNEVLGYMKTWIEGRSIWLDQNIPGVAQYCDVYEPVPDSVVGIPAPGKAEELKVVNVYPNPASDALYIQSVEEIEQITISNMLGQEVYSELRNGHYVKLSTVGIIPNGIYLVTVKTTGSLQVKKIVFSGN
ncbi:MAG TPA: T9SS type A sorting domain-containing protein, partial [Flavobacteriales bacterium]|nr:T9SS type A sorting domain-containing protein [Flavobacteriales bacterium]